MWQASCNRVCVKVKVFIVEDCTNDWNTEYCAIKCVNQTNSSLLYRVPELESTDNNSMIFSDISCNETRSPAKEYFK